MSQRQICHRPPLFPESPVERCGICGRLTTEPPLERAISPGARFRRAPAPPKWPWWRRWLWDRLGVVLADGEQTVQ